MSVCRVQQQCRTERPRKTKIGTEVVHVTRDSDTTFKVKVTGHFGWLFKSLHNLYGWHQFLRHRPERAAASWSWIFMEQGTLGAAGVRCVWAGAGLQHTDAGTYCVASCTSCSYVNLNWKLWLYITTCNLFLVVHSERSTFVFFAVRDWIFVAETVKRICETNLILMVGYPV